MKNILLSVVVICALVVAGIGGTLAGFVDTEFSSGNYFQMGMQDLLVNGKNDPIGHVIQETHPKWDQSNDFYVNFFNWGECEGSYLYIHVKDVVSTEAGVKIIDKVGYVYDGVTAGAAGIPFGYRPATGLEPAGPNVWSTEPEKIAEVGDGYIGQYWIDNTNPNLMGEDFACGVAATLQCFVEVCDDGADGILDNADDGAGGGIAGNLTIEPQEYKNHNWVVILAGSLADINCDKKLAGFLRTQTYAWAHFDFYIPEIYASEWYDPDTGLRWDAHGSNAPGVDYNGNGVINADDFQMATWPSNALQGDKATWDILFELNSDLFSDLPPTSPT